MWNFVLFSVRVLRLGKFQAMRVRFLDMENEYIDLTERNFHRFVRRACKPSGYVQ